MLKQKKKIQIYLIKNSLLVKSICFSEEVLKLKINLISIFRKKTTTFLVGVQKKNPKHMNNKLKIKGNKLINISLVYFLFVFLFFFIFIFFFLCI
jgi:hypothetical protein